MFADVSKEDMEKYSLLLDKSNDEIKKELQELCKDYYLQFIFNETSNFKVTADKLRSYLKLNIDAVDDYINYCLLVAINTLIEKLYHVKPIGLVNPGFEIERHQQKQAKYLINQNGITPGEVEQTIQHNRQANDLWILRSITDLTVDAKPNVPLPLNVANTGFANINYLGNGDAEIDAVAKLFIGMSYMMDAEKNENFKRWFENDYSKRP